MSKNHKKYSPAIISEIDYLTFSIPLYQRLFEWGNEQIGQLLDDLYAAFCRDEKSAYYIGMLTSHVRSGGSEVELVDGQQRFTAMVLLGIHFKWDAKFLMVKGRPRLRFIARDDDETYLMDKIEGRSPIKINDKMESGLLAIKSHLSKLTPKPADEKKFGDYIFKNLTFFLSELPAEYNAQELNTYFERMNTSGKSLENYEILKVEVMKRLAADKNLYAQVWNAVSIMEKTLLRRHKGEQESQLRLRYRNAILDIIENGDIRNVFESGKAKFDVDEDGADEAEAVAEPLSIGEIVPNSNNPFKIVKRRTEEHSPLFFSEFLLQVLYITIYKGMQDTMDDGISNKILGNPKDNGVHVTDFFDVRQLEKTFKWAFEKRNLDAEQFVKNLALYRLLMDYFIIRIDDDGEEPYPFELYEGDSFKAHVEKYLSMLYSASSAMTYYEWMPALFLYLEDYVKTNKLLNLPAKEYLDKLKELDNKWHPEEGLESGKLDYQTIDRYWFWRMDYYLWENRDLFFSGKQVAVASNYIFRRNRSIEHIAPQHPKDEFGDQSRFHWDDENTSVRDCLGNMVMISSGQNSSLSNSCFEVKRAVMERYSSGVDKGHVESLKMLYVYSKFKTWSIDNIIKHDEFTLDFLKATYCDSESKMKSLV